MAPNFSKNAVLTGTVDYYCLACESRFHTEENTNSHILTPSHKQNFEKTSYEAQDDCIRKIKVWYFCEYCNLLLKTKAKVRLHIAESKHVLNKINQYLKRYGDSIVAFDEVHINQEAWDGLCDGTCVICNCEYNNKVEHLKDAMHNINLIQSNIEFDNKNVYRMIDDTSFHCMTCNSLEALPVNNHFDSSEHVVLYQSCQQLAVEILANNLKNKISEEDIAQKKTSPAEQSFKTVENIVVKNPEVVTKDNKKTTKDSPVPSTAKPKPNTVKAKENVAPSKPDTKSTKPNDTKKKEPAKTFNFQESEAEITKILNTNRYITRDEKGMTWCILCDWVMDDYKIDSHVNGVHHRNILKLHKARFETINNTRPNESATNENINGSKTKGSVEGSSNGSKRSSLLDSVQKFEKNHNALPQQSTKLYSTPVSLKRPKERSPKPDESTKDIKNDAANKAIAADNRSKILEFVQTFQKNDININFETNTAMCKKCTKNVDFNYDTIQSHIAEHNESNIEEVSNKQNMKQIYKSPTKQKNKGGKTKDKPTELSVNESKILDAVPKFQENQVTVNFENNSAVCRICAINIEFYYESIEKHIADHKKGDSGETGMQNVKEESTKKDKTPYIQVRDEELDYAAVHNLKPLISEKQVYCEKCKAQIPFSIKAMKEHINSSIHQSFEVEKNKEKKTKVETVPIDAFIRNIVSLKNDFFQDDIINGELCISRFSNVLILSIPEINMFKCLCCDIYLTSVETDMHVQSPKHLRILIQTTIVTNVEDEFIRQMPINRYHCGFCNQVQNSWQEMETHLKSASHREAKVSAKWRLEQHAVVIAADQMRRDVQPKFTYDMLNRHLFN